MFIQLGHLITLAGRSAGFTGIWARRGVGDEVRVGRALCALASARVYVMSGRARHARRAGGLAAEGASLATRGHTIHSVAHRDGVDPRNVVDPLTELRGGVIEGEGEQNLAYIQRSQVSYS